MCGNSLRSYADLHVVLRFQANWNLIELYKTYILKARARDHSMQLSAWGVQVAVMNAITVSEALPRPFRNYSGRNCYYLGPKHCTNSWEENAATQSNEDCVYIYIYICVCVCVRALNYRKIEWIFSKFFKEMLKECTQSQCLFFQHGNVSLFI
jgi:hypothetical protein